MITTEASKRELRVDKINWLGSLRKIKNRNFRGNRSNVIDKFITLNNWNVRVICHSLFGIFFSALIVQKKPSWSGKNMLFLQLNRKNFKTSRFWAPISFINKKNM